MEHIIITGGLGFIGLNLIAELTQSGKYFIHNIDNFSLGHSYFANFLSSEQKARVNTYQADINDSGLVKQILKDHDIKKVFHLAAESHVDRSITNPEAFYQSNVMGTLALAESCREHIGLEKVQDFRFLHVSTDEVFGDLGPDDEPFNENTSYNPSSPYSASKAASDFIIKSWARTYGFPAKITNCSNNFGPCQNEEKFIPTIIKSIITNKPIPVYGSGKNVRDWLYVGNHIHALVELVERWPTEHQQYCIGGGIEISNIDLIKRVWSELQLRGLTNSNTWRDDVEYVADRKGHDFRYAINDRRIKSSLNLNWEGSFETFLKETINFYEKIYAHDIVQH